MMTSYVLQQAPASVHLSQEEMTPDLSARFLRYLDASPKTIETYRRALRQLFRYFAEKEITAPTREDILSFRNDLLIGHKATTVQNYLAATRVFFQWTEQEGLYPNVAHRIKGAKLDKQHKKDYLTSSQARSLLASIDRTGIKGARDYAILSLMITGGLRTIEVVRANREDIRTLGDFTVLYIQGKGKEDKAEYVKIEAHVEDALRAYLMHCGPQSAGAPLFASTSNQNRGCRITTRAISGIVKGRMREAGFNSDRLTAHSLRHTAVTLSLLAGKSLAEVQQFARHSNIATTQIYNHALERAQNSCAEAIASTLFSP